MSPLRAALSRRVTAAVTSAPGAASTCAFFRAVRRAERCARFRAMAALDLRMFFFADAIFGTDDVLHLVGAAGRDTRQAGTASNLTRFGVSGQPQANQQRRTIPLFPVAPEEASTFSRSTSDISLSAAGFRSARRESPDRQLPLVQSPQSR